MPSAEWTRKAAETAMNRVSSSGYLNWWYPGAVGYVQDAISAAYERGLNDGWAEARAHDEAKAPNPPATITATDLEHVWIEPPSLAVPESAPRFRSLQLWAPAPRKGTRGWTLVYRADPRQPTSDIREAIFFDNPVACDKWVREHGTDDYATVPLGLRIAVESASAGRPHDTACCGRDSSSPSHGRREEGSMSKPSARRIRDELRALRNVINTSADPCEARIAQSMETAILWATTDTVGWPPLHRDAKEMATILARELRERHA